MALNGDLNSVLNGVVEYNVAPVIKMTNGLYTLVNKKSINPANVLGTDLYGFIIRTCHTNDNIIRYFFLKGNWDAEGDFYYEYDNSTNTWDIVGGFS